MSVFLVLLMSAAAHVITETETIFALMSSSPRGPIKTGKIQYACSTIWPLYSLMVQFGFFFSSVQRLKCSLYLHLRLDVSPCFFGEWTVM